MMNKKVGLVIIGLLTSGLFANANPALAGQPDLMYYGKGVVDESSPFAGEIIRTIINKDKATVVHPGHSGIELVRMNIRASDVCIQTQSALCYVGTVTETKNTNIHEIGDEIGITLDLQNKKQTATVISGAMQGTTITINLSKTIVKSDAPFVISVTREGGFAGLPGRTITLDSSNNSITISDVNIDSTMDLSGDEIEKIATQVKKSNLLNIVQSDYPPHPSSADYFTYTLDITQGVFHKTFTWTDTSENVPKKLDFLNGLIVQVSETIDANDQGMIIADIALDFVRTAPTFAFDGMEETLSVGDILVLESFPEQYRLEVSFTSAHGGYGNRTGQIVTQALTPHMMSILISEGNVLSAVTDGEWDEMTHQYVLKEP
jgi:hypothetical protein